MDLEKPQTKRFQKILAEFVQLKAAGKLNGRAAMIKDELKDVASDNGLDFNNELEQITKKTRKNPLPSVESDAFGSFDSLKELKKKALRWAKEHLAGKKVHNIDQDIDIVINWQGIKKTSSSYLSENKLLSIKVLPALLKYGILFSKEPDKYERDEIKNIYKFSSLAKIDNCEYDVYLVVRETLQGKFFYDHNLSKIKKPGGSGNSPQRENMHQPSPGLHSKDMKNSIKRENPCGCQTRENPVDVPFTMTLKEIIDLRGLINSAYLFNSMLGAAAPCYTIQPWESTENRLMVFYIPHYNKKIFNLYLLIDGELEDSFCQKGSTNSKKNHFQYLLNELVKKWGDLKVVIYDQDHAKKVLGAKRYKQQEREFAKKQGKGSKKPKSKKKAKKPKKSSSKKSTIADTYEGYIRQPRNAAVLPVDEIEPRTSDISPEKLKRAKKLMQKAKQGQGELRQPIHVKLNSGNKYKWQVIDGNTTLIIAKNADWEKIPAVIEADHKKADKQREKPPESKPEKEKEQSGDLDLAAIQDSQNKINEFIDSLL
jgi:hypothetical protein